MGNPALNRPLLLARVPDIHPIVDAQGGVLSARFDQECEVCTCRDGVSDSV